MKNGTEWKIVFAGNKGRDILIMNINPNSD